MRSPELARLADALRAAGATVETDGDAARVRGLDAPAVGDLAAREGVALHELTSTATTLEEAFMESTESELEYHVAEPTEAP